MEFDGPPIFNEEIEDTMNEDLCLFMESEELDEYPTFFGEPIFDELAEDEGFVIGGKSPSLVVCSSCLTPHGVDDNEWPREVVQGVCLENNSIGYPPVKCKQPSSLRRFAGRIGGRIILNLGRMTQRASLQAVGIVQSPNRPDAGGSSERKSHVYSFLCVRGLLFTCSVEVGFCFSFVKYFLLGGAEAVCGFMC